MKRQNLNLIINALVALSYMALGALVLVICFMNKEYEALSLGIILIVSAGCRLIKFLSDHQSFDVHTIDLTMGLISIAFGFIFIFAHDIPLEHLCILWGAFEIINGAIEISMDVKLAKRSFLVLISVLISIGEIVFGTLLIVHLRPGIFIHLLYIGITSILTAGLLIFEFVKKLQERKQDE